MKSKSNPRLVRQNSYSTSLIIPKYIVKLLGLTKGTKVSCKVRGTKLIVQKVEDNE